MPECCKGHAGIADIPISAIISINTVWREFCEHRAVSMPIHSLLDSLCSCGINIFLIRLVRVELNTGGCN